MHVVDNDTTDGAHESNNIENILDHFDYFLINHYETLFYTGGFPVSTITK